MFMFDSKPSNSTGHGALSAVATSPAATTRSCSGMLFTRLASGAPGGAFAAKAIGIAAQADDRII
jgi:hypothetical protein